jgi:hypothetical protein
MQHVDQSGPEPRFDLQKRADRLGERTFMGVPTQGFEGGGREHFIYLVAAGLNPYSKVVDLGCGVLRLGYWLIHFLEPSCYCGIEPHSGRLAMGTQTILEPEILQSKRPRFDGNANFDTSVFGEKFDFFLAYSIWSHACKQQIGLMLDSFARDCAEQAIFLTSYFPADAEHPDYQGEKWVGTSHESDTPGVIHHSLDWIGAQCAARNLVFWELGKDRSYNQCWLAIKRSTEGEMLFNGEAAHRHAAPLWPWR